MKPKIDEIINDIKPEISDILQDLQKPIMNNIN